MTLGRYADPVGAIGAVVGRKAGPIGRLTSLRPPGSLINIDGPYAAPCTAIPTYKTVMLVSGGIGLTPFASGMAAVASFCAAFWTGIPLENACSCREMLRAQRLAAGSPHEPALLQVPRGGQPRCPHRHPSAPRLLLLALPDEGLHRLPVVRKPALQPALALPLREVGVAAPLLGR
jgi:ferredoxin-NADP reductase|eukprot:COSAG01_NODE_4813_length_4725_cov_2.371812_3_plen_176_part_00